MNLNEFVCKHDVDFAAHLISRNDVSLAEETLGIKFGPQLEEYLLDYGYLGFESTEFYGMNSRQGLESDLIVQTKYLHKYYSSTMQYIALENNGEGDYILLDTDDNVYQFVSEEGSLKPLCTKLVDYILKRFTEEL